MNNNAYNPFNEPENEYYKSKQIFKDDYSSRTASIKDDSDLAEHAINFAFDEWLNDQKKELGRIFFKVKKGLDKDNLCYFGCPLKNYAANYKQRLDEFSNKFDDVEEKDFINTEMWHLEYTLLDIQNCESSHDGYSYTGNDNFQIAFEIVNYLGYDQFLFSTNKKIDYLSEKLKSLTPLITTRQNPELNESELSKKIKEHFTFLVNDRGRKNIPMMTNKQFQGTLEILEDYFSNNFALTKSYEVIKTENVTKKIFLFHLKEFYFKQPVKPSKIPYSLVELANMITQTKWKKVDMPSMHRASIE
jgi:hypothetical protein